MQLDLSNQSISISTFKTIKITTRVVNIDNEVFHVKYIRPKKENMTIHVYEAENKELILRNNYGDVVYTKNLLLGPYIDFYSMLYFEFGPLIFEYKLTPGLDSLEHYLLLAGLKYTHNEVTEEIVKDFCFEKEMNHLLPECLASLKNKTIIAPLSGEDVIFCENN